MQVQLVGLWRHRDFTQSLRTMRDHTMKSEFYGVALLSFSIFPNHARIVHCREVFTLDIFMQLGCHLMETFFPIPNGLFSIHLPHWEAMHPSSSSAACLIVFIGRISCISLLWQCMPTIRLFVHLCCSSSEPPFFTLKVLAYVSITRDIEKSEQGGLSQQILGNRAFIVSMAYFDTNVPTLLRWAKGK